MDIFLLVIGAIFVLAGMIGAIVPGLPGPVLSYGAILLLHFVKGDVFSSTFLVVWGALVLFSQIVDYLFPILGAKFWGVSKKGIWGSIIGMLIGMFILPPIGMILGTFVGAVIGEIIGEQKNKKAIQAGLVIFMANLASLFFQFVVASVLAVYYFAKVF